MQDTKPVQVSGDATAAFAGYMRQWSGWKNCRLSFGDTEPVSPWAWTDRAKREFRFNVDNLLLNPNRVLRTLTPFRMKQEAVLTGAMLHEAGHARYSRWLTEDEPRLSDGSKPSDLVMWLARMMEEPRIEGQIAVEAKQIGAGGLVWTLRAMAAHLMPVTPKEFDSEDQMLLAFIQSWLLRAGRCHALTRAGIRLPGWTTKFDLALIDAMSRQMNGDAAASTRCFGVLKRAVMWDGDMYDDDGELMEPHTGPYMLNSAKSIIDCLFPGLDQPEPPAGASCGHGQPEQGAGGDAGGSPESGEQEAGEGGGQSDSGEAGDGEGEGATGSTKVLVKVLVPAELTEAEASADGEVDERIKESREDEEAKARQGQGGGVGRSGIPGVRLRPATKEDREYAKEAERFLRDLIDPGMASTLDLTDAPSAMVDAKELAVYRASGGKREPKFFRRLQRNEKPVPPVKIAVLVDVSSSMDMMQEPSALLSWALASAAIDLRNFAGRGQKIESCLIHWGDAVQVIQPNGEMMPGVPVRECNQGTSRMGDALLEVEEQMPGFLDGDGTPQNRLLVQFTDWELNTGAVPAARVNVQRALRSGVKMLSVTPPGWYRSNFFVKVNQVDDENPAHRVVNYDHANPHAVWETAAQMLR